MESVYTNRPAIQCVVMGGAKQEEVEQPTVFSLRSKSNISPRDSKHYTCCIFYRSVHVLAVTHSYTETFSVMTLV